MPGLAMMVAGDADELDGAEGERVRTLVEHRTEAEVIDDRLGERRQRSMVGNKQVADEVPA